ncbi:hypothetical protein C8R45DRAFT_941264 [Mycena sanguinolenta]|nr:hypothetical protein C8R45DRAFT_941264 [Mycena sanguinolenta]
MSLAVLAILAATESLHLLRLCCDKFSFYEGNLPRITQSSQSPMAEDTYLGLYSNLVQIREQQLALGTPRCSGQLRAINLGFSSGLPQLLMLDDERVSRNPLLATFMPPQLPARPHTTPQNCAKETAWTCAARSPSVPRRVGLSAAFRLKQLKSETSLPLRVILLEKGSAVGFLVGRGDRARGARRLPDWHKHENHR